MAAFDRLTSLLDRFRLQVRGVDVGHANLIGLREPDAIAAKLVFQPQGCVELPMQADVLFALAVDFGGEEHPLLTALPDRVVEVSEVDGDLASLVALLSSEYGQPRCGSPAVLGRLGEVLMVRILRRQIEKGAANTGLLGALAHPRISRAIVAIHEDPGRPWQNADLAAIAGLSHSRFKEVFAEVVGKTPASYLRCWRLSLARMDLQNGDRVEQIARRYGYRAPDAFSRAFVREFGVRPTRV